MEQKKKRDFHFNGGDEGVLLWVEGLPDADKLTPLSQSLISPDLASAFRILSEPRRSSSDVNSASKTTIMNISDGQLEGYRSLEMNNAPAMVESDEAVDPDEKLNKVGFVEEPNSIEDAALARTLKRPRVAWTPQLHKRFVDVVSHLGLKDAAPKAIMQLMNVEGLTRENVASHLQKYRLYMKRSQISSATDEALVPMPPAAPNSHESSPSVDSLGNGYFPATFPMGYVPSPMMPLMFYGMGAHGHGLNHAGVPMVNMSTVPTHSAGSKGQQD